jgi:predicted nuclease of restriction endonuclease-like (RecB) superfamily
MSNSSWGDAALIIKDAIIRSRYQAATLVNRELLSLYYAVGRYVSQNSRVGSWGKGAIKQISNDLQKELPGLRGFSEVSIKRMRLFYEAWQPVFLNRPLATDDLNRLQKVTNRPLATDDLRDNPNFETNIDLSLLSKHINSFDSPEFFITSFYKVGFTHHSEILAKEKTLDGKYFYITQCAAAFWTVEALKSHLRGKLYQSGRIPNNFLLTLPEQEQAQRAIRSYKDEYFLDYINIEDENDPDERVFAQAVIADVKKFILSFGNLFCFMGNQYRVMVDEQEFFIDMLFYNRELRCLVAIELKRGKFEPSHLGQLNFYLSALDEYVKLEDEAQSIGILLCKEANRNIVEFAVRDYTKPLGVATYRTRNEMPEEWKNALPDVEDMRKLLEAASDEDEAEVGE